jgi:RND family efflux transporter MFP subunit
MNHRKAGSQLSSWVLLALLSLAGCSGERHPVAPAPEPVRNVAVFAAQQATVPDVLEAIGTVRAAQTSDLASQMMGNIVDVRVHEGDHVRQDQVLAVIDDSQPRATLDRTTAADLAAQQQLVAAESDLALAQSTLKRYQNLYERKSVSPQEFDEVKARQQAALARRNMAEAGQVEAEAALTQARTSLEYTRIRAPFDGVVAERKTDRGTFASPGMPIFTIEDVRRYRLEATVNEGDLRDLRMGQPVLVTIDALDNADLKGKVVEIVPTADPTSRTFLVKIELAPDARLRSGLFGRARFSRGQRQALLIPRSAVVERGQLQGIFVLDQNRVASLRYITLGKSSGSDVEVLAGLQNGEHVVTGPGERDLNGKRIDGE